MPRCQHVRVDGLWCEREEHTGRRHRNGDREWVESVTVFDLAASRTLTVSFPPIRSQDRCRPRARRS